MWKARATATEKIELKPRARRPATVTSQQATAIINQGRGSSGHDRSLIQRSGGVWCGHDVIAS